MPRGRPKGSKNKSKVENLFVDSVAKVETTTPVVEDIVETPVRVEYKTDTTCEVCGCVVHCQRIPVQLITLCGKAFWHRKLTKDRFYICDSCAEKLSDSVENCLLSINRNLEKFV